MLFNGMLVLPYRKLAQLKKEINRQQTPVYLCWTYFRRHSRGVLLEPTSVEREVTLLASPTLWLTELTRLQWPHILDIQNSIIAIQLRQSRVKMLSQMRWRTKENCRSGSVPSEDVCIDSGVTMGWLLRLECYSRSWWHYSSLQLRSVV